MLQLRKAHINDHDFLVRIDLKNDGYTSSNETQWTPDEIKEHLEKILTFLKDRNKGAYIFEDTGSHTQVGMIMYCVSNRDTVYPWKSVFNELDRGLFQSDGRFMEIFQLWVHPDYRRLGLATQLKRQIETEAKRHEVNLIYTHTEEANEHVIELNKKLGYQEVRRGPIWDDIIRVSLIKHLEK
jgi:ribosomal protein S18 acetylase RimI-like enzyme